MLRTRNQSTPLASLERASPTVLMVPFFGAIVAFIHVFILGSVGSADGTHIGARASLRRPTKFLIFYEGLSVLKNRGNQFPVWKTFNEFILINFVASTLKINIRDQNLWFLQDPT